MKNHRLYRYSNIPELASSMNGYVDLVVEGGIGYNTYLYRKIRSGGFEGRYVGVNDRKSLSVLPDELEIRTGDCLNLRFIYSMISEFSARHPIFTTNEFLVALAKQDGKRKRLVSILTDSPYRMQIHRHPLPFSTLINEKYGFSKRRYKIALKSKPAESLENVSILTKFIEESEQNSWRVSLPVRDVLVLRRA